MNETTHTRRWLPPTALTIALLMANSLTGTATARPWANDATRSKPTQVPFTCAALLTAYSLETARTNTTYALVATRSARQATDCRSALNAQRTADITAIDANHATTRALTGAWAALVNAKCRRYDPAALNPRATTTAARDAALELCDD